MKAVILMFDTLNRHFLPPYGNTWVHAPNFQRLAERSVTFDRSYVCSMPCMPARRELHTGRPNFLHRFWGPLEPYDDSIFEILRREKGVYSHLATDHYHYFEDGGATYHNRYNSWEFFRGQGGDLWKGQVADPVYPPCMGRNSSREHMVRADWVTRQFLGSEELLPTPRTVEAGVDFLRRNHRQDNWLLQIECFSPHEPFFSPRKYKDLYADHYDRYRAAGGKLFDWPMYGQVTETPVEIEHIRCEYASLLSMCDAHLGEVMDAMDELDLWKDTMLIVWTDHGLLLGEHDCWCKQWVPFYEEVSHTPFFVWDPRCAKKGERRNALVQPALDIPLTMLNYFGAAPTGDMLGKDLTVTIAEDAPVREAALFGAHGVQVNVTDGRYVYHRAAVDPKNQKVYEYTVMPANMMTLFAPERMREAVLVEAFSFTKGCPLLRVPRVPSPPLAGFHPGVCKTELFDLERDPRQSQPLKDEEVERRMVELMVKAMKECDAPKEQYERLGIGR